ncbi:MAG: serine hydrolase [Opitutae bacterium]|nr:serine hydrolase [Opitutae bacterium]
MNAFRNLAPLAWSFLFLWTSVQAKELPRAKPEEVGMSAAKLAKVDEVMLDFVAKKKLAGAIVAVARHGKVVHFGTYGKMDLERDKEMTEDAIFRIYSMSKAITTAAALMLLEEGKYSLDDPVSKYIPEFKELTVWENGESKPAESVMTVKQLMLHTSGLSYGFVGNGHVEQEYKKRKPLDHQGSLQGMTKTLSEIPLAFEPGSKWQYSVSIDVLGRLIEIWSGKSFETFLSERVFKPLDMKDTAFFVPKNKADRFTTNYSPAGPGKLRPIDHPARSRYLVKPSLASGGGGLVSTTRDYLRFLQMTLNGGELHGVRLLKKKTVRLMTRNQLPKKLMPIQIGQPPRKGVGFSLGFSVRVGMSEWDPSGKVGEFGWGGAASTHYWVSPKDDLVVVTMEQVMPYSFMTEWGVKKLIYDAVEK